MDFLVSLFGRSHFLASQQPAPSCSVSLANNVWTKTNQHSDNFHLTPQRYQERDTKGRCRFLCRCSKRCWMCSRSAFVIFRPSSAIVLRNMQEGKALYDLSLKLNTSSTVEYSNGSMKSPNIKSFVSRKWMGTSRMISWNPRKTI